jgi:hypothetical protein
VGKGEAKGEAGEQWARGPVSTPRLQLSSNSSGMVGLILERRGQNQPPVVCWCSGQDIFGNR